MRCILAAILLAALCGPASAEDGDLIRVIDGDTLMLPGRERVRLLDIDAPESFRSRCETELVLGLRAKARLAEILRGRPVQIERHGQDRYRRTLAVVSVGGRSVGAVLVAEGLALPWRSGAAAKKARLLVWCGRARW